MKGKADDESKVVTLEVSGRKVTASVCGTGACAIVLGPGAGGTRETPQLLRVAAALDPLRYTTVLFNFPYKEAGRSFPDAPAVLEETVATVAAFARAELRAQALVLGGRSMGGRIASQAAAKGLKCDGLAFLAYPLHPPGDVTKLRNAHLPAISVPMLFLQGTRDVFARLDLLEATVSGLGSHAELTLFPEADHSFKTPRGAAASSKETELRVRSRLAEWLEKLTAAQGAVEGADHAEP